MKSSTSDIILTSIMLGCMITSGASVYLWLKMWRNESRKYKSGRE